MTPVISVVIPTHNPQMDYLRRVIEALRQQTLAKGLWELVIVDNGSRVPLAESIRHTAEGIQLEDRSQRSEIGEQRSDARQGDLKLKNLKHNTPELELGWHPYARIVREEELGLTFARLRGFAEAKGELIVMVDDDNVLAPDYLENAVKIAEQHKDIGAFGGKCLPEFETQPEPWMEEFLPLLALRDHGDKEIIAGDARSADGSRRVYPDRAAPIGAGMVVRREAARAYAERLRRGNEEWESEKYEGGRVPDGEGIRHTADGKYGASAGQCCSRAVGSPELPKDRITEPSPRDSVRRSRGQLLNHLPASVLTDRRGDSLASAGDNDLVFTILRDGWKVGYFPQLHVTHLIPSNRLTVDYLARANRGVQRSWVEVLRKHGAGPRPVIPAWSAPIRKARAIFKYRGWRKPEGFILWQGALGKFDGLQIESVR